MTRPFRFSASVPMDLVSEAQWRTELRRMEDLGLSTAVLPDHFTGPYAVEPLVGLTAAAMCTSTLRLMTGVLGNDYRHPVLVHRMAATVDVLSGGRLELGMGAGWMESDYVAGGIELAPPGVRVSRLVESVQIVKGLFGEAPFSFEGEHYRVHELDGLPKPVQRPRPPLFIGGGSKRVLRLAGREADIVGVHRSLRAGAVGPRSGLEFLPERVEERLVWVREGAEAAGRSFDALELGMNHWFVEITPTMAIGRDILERRAAELGITPEVLADCPGVLVGTLEECAERLLARRERFGVSYVNLDVGIQNDLDALAPLIARLTGA